MVSKTLYRLPIEDTGHVGDIRISANGISVLFEYEYYSIESHKDLIGVIMFDWAIAMRFHDELHSKDFCGDSYLALVEIFNSRWIQDLYNKEPSGNYKSVINLHHYALFYPDSGYLEVIADKFVLLDPREGKLPELQQVTDHITEPVGK